MPEYATPKEVEEVIKEVGPIEVEYLERGVDPRNYRIDFSRIRETLGFRASFSIGDGVREVKNALENGFFADPWSPKYTN